ncbi:putative SET domain-containing protein [Ordospora pajunii]|uniref:putative SET domain-containing protein n=1 Tax=Ordospora pajunii TaxID=3039483 RepID=UPI0029527302|nr:putative SET domain-containing protein [Ordospora pajunii]KAH9410747.1 putative SET domain-containing protein [Ordospora pajunii]
MLSETADAGHLRSNSFSKNGLDIESIIEENYFYANTICASLAHEADLSSTPSACTFNPRASKIVIPRIDPSISSVYFTYSDVNVQSGDDAVLHYIPYICSALLSAVVLKEYKSIGFARKDCDDYQESARMVANTTEANAQPIVNSLKYMRMQFCSVCLIFGCKWHCIIDGICIKPTDFEKDPQNAFMATKMCHSGVCNSMNAHYAGRVSTIGTLNIYEKNKLFIAYSQSKGDACIASLIFCIRHGKYVSCSEISSTYNAQMHLWSFKHIAKSKTKRSQTKVDKKVFFTPCSHTGKCSKKNGCVCAANRTYCEMACLCVGCNNFFTGCSCSDGCRNGCKCSDGVRECTPMCGCTECDNKSIQLGIHAKTYVSSSKVSGCGLFAAECISEGSFVIEYTGEIISDGEAERRGVFYDIKGCSYLFDLCIKNGKPQYVIDSKTIGNNSRFINHSVKHANLLAVAMNVNGSKRIGLYATTDIRIHQELYFDYGYSNGHKLKHGIID